MQQQFCPKHDVTIELSLASHDDINFTLHWFQHVNKTTILPSFSQNLVIVIWWRWWWWNWLYPGVPHWSRKEIWPRHLISWQVICGSLQSYQYQLCCSWCHQLQLFWWWWGCQCWLKYWWWFQNLQVTLGLQVKDLTFELKFWLKPIVYENNKALYIEEKMCSFWKSIARVIAVTVVLNLWRRRSKWVYYQINQRPRICSDTLVTGIAQMTILAVRNQEPTFSRLKFRGFLILVKEQPAWFWYKSKLVAHGESDCRRSRHDARSGG